MANKNEEEEKTNSAVDIDFFFIFREQEKCSSVWISVFFFFVNFISVRIGKDIGKVFFSPFRSQQPNVYGRFFARTFVRLFPSDA